MSVNKVTLVGFVGAKPEIRTFTNGGKVANLRLATSERWRDKNSGEMKEQTEWHSIVVSGDGLVDLIEKSVDKGSQLYIEGKLQTRKWQDQQGADKYTTEIRVGGPNSSVQFLDRKGSNGGDSTNHNSHDAGGSYNQGGNFGGHSGGGSSNNGAFSDDHIPF